MEVQPPKYPLDFFRWFCRPEIVEDIEGDLVEKYNTNVESLGLRKARRKFAIQVLKLFRPGIIRPLFRDHFNFKIMFRHNLKLAFRNFYRYKSSFLINSVGLASGLACAILIYLWVSDELRVDKFHEKSARIYQILEHRKHEQGTITDVMTSGPFAEMLRKEFPEVEHAAAVGPASWPGSDNFTVSVDDKNVRGTGQFAESDFFNIFSYKFIEGSKSEVLTKPNAIILTKSIANKLFGTSENLLGKFVKYQQERDLMVTGIIEDLPVTATDRFDFVLSYELLREIKPWVDNWGSTGPKVYLTLMPGSEAEVMNEKLLAFAKSKAGDEELSRIPFVQRYSDIYLHGRWKDGVLIGGRIEYVRLFSYIAMFILLIACINFMNLSTARASRKLTEIGVKKVIGAGRGNLMVQYLGESMLLALLSLTLAITAVLLVLPKFNLITNKLLRFDWTLSLLLPLLGLTFLVGLVAGSYPAVFLSKFQPLQIFRGQLSSGRNQVWTRRSLVTFQFTLTIVFMVAVAVTYNQIKFIQNKHLGYDKENVIWFDIEGKLQEDPELFLNNVKSINGVVNASATSHRMVGQNWSMQGMQWKGSDPDNNVNFEIMGVDYDFIETMGIEIENGRSFSRVYGTEKDHIIFNEKAIQTMGLENPLGEKVNFFMGEKEIVGVVRDFHFESLHQEVRPVLMVLFNPEQGLRKVFIRISPINMQQTIQSIQALYESYNADFSFNYHFLEETYEHQYQAEQRVATLSRYFASLAVIISCLGLFGLVAFTIERRMKEVAIRKVLGSTTLGLVRLLSREYLWIVLLSFAIALPISIVFARNWLNSFVYQVELKWWYFGFGGMICLLIAGLMVVFQTVKASVRNPIESIRNE